MNLVEKRLLARALGLLLLTGLYACVATAPGYGGDYYEPDGYVYGDWGPGYYVGPTRGGERRRERSSPHAYRAAPQSRRTPSIPTRSRDRDSRPH